MLKVTCKELPIDLELKTRIQFICNFCNVKPTFLNGSIRNIDKTNLSYIEPNKVIIKGVTFLVFNYGRDIYVENLNTRINIIDMKNYIMSL